MIVFFLSACGTQSARKVEEPIPYQPPALSTPTAVTAPPAAVDEPLQPSPKPDCKDGLLFVDDLTIPDGTKVSPGERLDKRWLVKNIGGCNWDIRYQIALVAGTGLGAHSQQALYPALSGTEVTIQMIFLAPEEVGTYRSAWQAYNADQHPFGDTIYIDIEVVEGNNPDGG
ncbi:MAG: NBR1-Ig-like domain-containing protein, partial [Chloroflexota bacterium]